MRDRVLEAIQRKVDGQDITADATPDGGGKIIDLMEALKASLARRQGGGGDESAKPSGKCREGAGRHQRLRVQGVEGALLSRPISPTTECSASTRADFRRWRSTTRSIGCPRRTCCSTGRRRCRTTFTFAIKASQRITHHARLKPEAAELVAYLLRTTSVLGAKLGPILFQLPPNLKKDIDRLRTFLALLPADRRFTMEFRHESWFDDDVVAELRARDVALCVSEQEEFQSPVLATATWGYLRLHRFDYDAAALAEWAKRVAAQPWKEAYVFFKHDHTAGSGPPAVDAFLKAAHG